MTAVKVCRVCLQMGVNLLKLHSGSLDHFYEIITGICVEQIKLPMYACQECALLLKKYYYFRQKCMRALMILKSILQYQDEITERDILKIDREAILLNTTLTLSKNVCDINIDPTKNNIQNDEVEIKTFPNVPLDNLFFDMDPFEAGTDKEWPSDDDFIGTKDDDSEDDLIALSKLGVVKVESKSTETQKTPMRRPRKTLKKEKPIVSISKQHKIRIRKGKGFITPQDINLPKDIDLKFDDNFTVAETTKEEQIAEIKKRQDSERFRKAEFKCQMCYKCFSNDKLWQMHKERHDLSAGEAECEICKLRFSRAALKRHMYSVHSKKYLCKQCPFIASTFNRAKQHMLQHKGVKYKCPHCDEVTNNLNAILGHVRKRHASDILCRFCGLPFVSRMGLIRHKALMHRDRDEITEIEDNPEAPHCSECDMKFANEEAFKRHRLTARKHKDATKNTIGCRECGETFANKKDRREHSSIYHKRTHVSKPTPAEWPDKCPLCSEVITSARSLWAHFRMNHPYEEYPRERPFICDVCGMRMRYKKGLEAHMYTHLKEKPFKCLRCGKGFNSAGNLATHHGSVHSDLRPYVCTVCNRAFKKKNTLRCHFMTHTGEKPYRCEICGHAFTQSNSCKSHIRKVHGEQPPKIVSRNNYSN
ncbi:zinc finger protein 879-like isoform X1 [Pieris brassicae]|nr:zinc finger protein 879-like isoform X1 [Pieris brassicae]